jgi:hypothetical protein
MKNIFLPLMLVSFVMNQANKAIAEAESVSNQIKKTNEEANKVKVDKSEKEYKN